MEGWITTLNPDCYSFVFDPILNFVLVTNKVTCGPPISAMYTFRYSSALGHHSLDTAPTPSNSKVNSSFLYISCLTDVLSMVSNHSRLRYSWPSPKVLTKEVSTQMSHGIPSHSTLSGDSVSPSSDVFASQRFYSHVYFFPLHRVFPA